MPPLVTPTTDTLYILTHKMNGKDRSFSFKSYVSGGTDADARDRCLKIGQYLKWLLPTTVEIVYAAYSLHGSNRDARAVQGARGLGLYGSDETTPRETVTDASQTHLKMRCESDKGNAPTRKIGPLPDDIVSDDALVTVVDGVVFPVVGPIPAPGAAGTGAASGWWFQRLTAFMQYWGTNTVHVSGLVPGVAEYNRYAWAATIPWSIGKKKGGRAIVL